MRTIVDVSTSVRYIGRNAVGIVRTEREIARYAIFNIENTELVYFDRETQDFRNVAKNTLLLMIPDISESNNQNIRNASEAERLFLFQDDDVFISAGLQWDIDFISAVYHKKMQINITFVQIVYDIIPIIMPEYCVPGMDVLFPKFIMDTAWTADIIYAISDATKRDLESFVATLQTRNRPSVRKITLGCDIPPDTTNKAENLDLRSGKYVLYVSTIEPRKNHKILFDAWREISNHPNIDLPDLVFVGNTGWNTSDLISMIESCPRLFPDKIKILNNVSDGTLEWLYNNALFTVYPSLYEGWGLPIAESLARGTPCIASSTSSMPEVAEGLCELLSPYDGVGWQAKIADYISNPEILRNLRSDIKSNYRIKTWKSAMIDFYSDLHAVVRA